MQGTIDETKGPGVVTACIVCIVVSSVAIVLRLWSRSITAMSRFWWDDYLAIMAWLFAVANCGLSIYWAHIGLGRHMQAVVEEGTTVPTLLIPLFAEDFLYNTATTAVKLSALLFYARVFRTVSWYKVSLWTVGAFVVAWWLAFTVLAILTCIPVQKIWDPTIPGHCLNQHSTFIATAAPNVTTDLVILLLPMPMLWNLRTNINRKVGLAAVFMVGYCVMIVSIVRLVTVIQFDRGGGKDFTWDWVESQLLVIVEPPLGVVSICMPSCVALNTVLRQSHSLRFSLIKYLRRSSVDEDGRGDDLQIHEEYVKMSDGPSIISLAILERREGLESKETERLETR